MRRRRIIDSSEREDEQEVQEIDMMSTTSTSFASSSFAAGTSDMDISTLASQDRASTKASREPWAWAVVNGWAEHFESPTEKGIRCLYPGCPKKYYTTSMTTSGANRHLRSVHKINKESGVNDGSLSRSGPLDALFHPSKQARVFDPTRFDDLLVRYIVRTKQPFSAVESPELQELLNHCTMASMSQVKLPSSDTIARKVKEKYADAAAEVTDMLSSVPKLSLTADAWTGPSQKDFLGVTAHWIDDSWVQKELVIGFEPLDGAHTGKNLAEAMVNLAERFHIGEKIQSITTDNASNMTAMVTELVKHERAVKWNLQGKLLHVPCLGHVINLAVQAMMGPDGLNDLAPETNDPYAEGEQDDADSPANNLTALAKLRKGIVRIKASPQRIRRFAKICVSEDCEVLKLKRDVRTRWNSTHEMLERAIELKAAYQSMCRSEPPLRSYELEEDDWIYLEKLVNLLERFNDLTKSVSGSLYPTINRAMTVYNKLIDRLDDVIASEDDLMLVQAAIQGRTKLLKYYSKTDSTPVYAVATAMDPRMRFHWWNVQKWGEYIQISVDAVTAVWVEQYKGKDGPRVLESHVAKEMELYGIAQQDGELEVYVREGATLVNSHSEPPELVYWRGQAERWPNLSNMARDYLAIPVTSTPSERCFSQAKFVLPPERNALLSTTVQRLVTLDSWLKYFPDL